MSDELALPVALHQILELCPEVLAEAHARLRGKANDRGSTAGNFRIEDGLSLDRKRMRRRTDVPVSGFRPNLGIGRGFLFPNTRNLVSGDLPRLGVFN